MCCIFKAHVDPETDEVHVRILSFSGLHRGHLGYLNITHVWHAIHNRILKTSSAGLMNFSWAALQGVTPRFACVHATHVFQSTHLLDEHRLARPRREGALDAVHRGDQLR